MNSEKAIALIELKCVEQSEPAFHSGASGWVKSHPEVTYFDFDNHSEGSLIELALHWVRECQAVFLIIGETQPGLALGGFSKFLNAVTRRHGHKSRVIHMTQDKRLAPFLKLLESERHYHLDSVRVAFENWIKSLETGPHQPEKENDL